MKKTSEKIRVFNALTLTRNMSNHPFPVALTEESSKELFNDMLNVLNDTGLIRDLKLAGFDAAAGPAFRGEMATKFSFDTAEYEQVYEGKTVNIKSGYLMNGDRDCFVALNCGEHMRLMQASTNLTLSEIWGQVDQCDSLLENQLSYAFDEQYGYLMSDIGWVGTGLKVTTVLDLPCLNRLSYMERIIEAATHLGVTVEKVFDNSAEGSYYRLSNRNTLGLDEAGIIEKIEQVAAEIIKKETDARETLFISKRLELEDRVMRSYGVIKYSRLLKREEFYRCLSDLKIGIYLDLIEDVEDSAINELIFRHAEADHEGTEAKPVGALQTEAALSHRVKGLIRGVK